MLHWINSLSHHDMNVKHPCENMKSLFGRLLPYPVLKKQPWRHLEIFRWGISLLISTFEPLVSQMLLLLWSRLTSSETHVAFPDIHPKAHLAVTSYGSDPGYQPPWFWGCTVYYEQGFDSSQAHWEGGTNGSIAYLRHLVKPNRKPVESTWLTGNTVEEVRCSHWCVNPLKRAELSLPSCFLWHLEHCLWTSSHTWCYQMHIFFFEITRCLPNIQMTLNISRVPFPRHRNMLDRPCVRAGFFQANETSWILPMAERRWD